MPPYSGTPKLTFQSPWAHFWSFRFFGYFAWMVSFLHCFNWILPKWHIWYEELLSQNHFWHVPQACPDLPNAIVRPVSFFGVDFLLGTCALTNEPTPSARSPPRSKWLIMTKGDLTGNSKDAVFVDQTKGHYYVGRKQLPRWESRRWSKKKPGTPGGGKNNLCAIMCSLHFFAWPGDPQFKPGGIRPLRTTRLN